ncbi:MAG: LysM peptidoglycan-binding domain-containing protein [Alphaproteobacteria bacterium]|nr:LysM peptidoglycan-binding domain-containing protein [Alphaproteobacteria bacterium]
MENSCLKKYKPSSKKWILASRCAGLRRNSALIPANAGLFHYAGNNPIRYIDPTGAFDWNTNTIEDGDTLSQIAEDCYTKYGVNYTTDDLKDLNKDTISDKDKIYAGTHLNLGKVEEVQRRAADYQSRATTKYPTEVMRRTCGAPWQYPSGCTCLIAAVQTLASGMRRHK